MTGFKREDPQTLLPTFCRFLGPTGDSNAGRSLLRLPSSRVVSGRMLEKLNGTGQDPNGTPVRTHPVQKAEGQTKTKTVVRVVGEEPGGRESWQLHESYERNGLPFPKYAALPPGSETTLCCLRLEPPPFPR